VCPGLHDELKQAVRELQGAARGALAGLPVLRDCGRADVRSSSRPFESRPPAGRRRVDSALDGGRALTDPDQARRVSGLAGEILARIERPGCAPAQCSTSSRELGETHYAEHRGEAVLRRARRVHHLGPDACARRRGRGRDRHASNDDRRDESPPTRSRDDPRRPSRIAMPDNLRPRFGLARGGEEREIALWFTGTMSSV
jgi:hypothetical protein